MRQFIRLISLVVLLSTALFWLTQGAHQGWSQRYATRMELDPVTEVEYPVKDVRFIPGVDFLGLSALVAALIFSSSFMFRRRIPREISLSKREGSPGGDMGRTSDEAPVQEDTTEAEPEDESEESKPEENERRLT